MPESKVTRRWLWLIGLNLLTFAIGIATAIADGDSLSFLVMGFGLSGTFHGWLLYNLTKRAERMRTSAKDVIDMSDDLIAHYAAMVNKMLEEKHNVGPRPDSPERENRRLH